MKIVIKIVIQLDQNLENKVTKKNKYASLKAAFADLDVKTIRINQTITLDGSSTSVLDSNTAFLYATDTENGKPGLFVRKSLDSIKVLGGVISDAGDAPERLIFASPNPITVTGSARYLAIAITGYENVICAISNPYGLAKFVRI